MYTQVVPPLAQRLITLTPKFTHQHMTVKEAECVGAFTGRSLSEHTRSIDLWHNDVTANRLLNSTTSDIEASIVTTRYKKTGSQIGL